MKRTVVILHPGALGDVLLAVPALRRLRTRFPNHRLVLCAGSEVSSLLAICGLVDEWTSWQSGDTSALFTGADHVGSRWQQWCASCDLAVGWMQDTEGALAARLRSWGTQQVIMRSPFSDDLKAVHQSDRFLEILGDQRAEPAQGFAPSEASKFRHAAQESSRKQGLPDGAAPAFIHPGSGSRTKCVGPESLAPVVWALQERGVTPVILEGPADSVQITQLIRATLPATPFVLKGLDLVTVAGLVTRGALFIGHDSGLTHLAALIGIPTIALFGPTDPARWAPRAAQVTVLNGGPSLTIPAGQVLSACQTLLQEKVHR